MYKMAAPLRAAVCSRVRIFFTKPTSPCFHPRNLTLRSFQSSTSACCQLNCDDSILKVKEIKGNYSGRGTDSNRRSVPFLSVPSALAFSLFSKKDKDDPENPNTDNPDAGEEGKIALSDLQTNKSESDQLVMMLKKAKLHEIRGEHMEADKLYHQALGVLNIYQHHKEWPADRILKARVWVFDAMAQMALMRRQFQQAEKCFKDVIKGLLEAGYDKHDNAIVEVSLKLAMIYAITKRESEAQEGYKFCIETQERKINKVGHEADQNTVALLGLCIDAYSRFLMVQKNYKSALGSLEKALSIAIRVFGNDHAQVAVLHNDIATVATYDGNFKKARTHAEKAIAIGEKTESVELSTFYYNLGLIHLQNQEYKDAMTQCDKSLVSVKKTKDKQTGELAKKCIEAVRAAMKKDKKD